MGPLALLLAQVNRPAEDDALRALPKLRAAAAKLAAALGVLMDPSAIPAGASEITLTEVWAEIERAVPRAELVDALATLVELLPAGASEDDDGWRAALVERYATVRGFVGLLVHQVEFGAVPAAASLIMALRGLLELVGRKKVTADELDRSLLAGSWRRLVLAGPECPRPRDGEASA